LAQELQDNLREVVADRSDPREMRTVLEQYFFRKQHQLKHKKYKLMLRWAHHATTSRSMDHLSQEATFRSGKLQQELDNTIERHQRLSQDDDYSIAMNPDLRPSSKSKKGDSTLYVEIKDLPAQSVIRQDDIEVYLRHTCYNLKINKHMNKVLSGLKWLPMTQRFEIFDEMVKRYFETREAVQSE
jgi:hypothetical protein